MRHRDEATLGLFDFLKKNDEKKTAKAAATVKNAKAIKEDRVAAIEYFKDYDEAHIAVPALLQRFEFSLEHGINDTREKESCAEGILKHGAAALPHVREHLLVTNRIAWPIKLLKQLADEKQAVEVLKSSLDFADVRFDQAKVDKNYDILCYLVDYKMPDFVDKLSHFLNDIDERVRFAVTELLVEQDHPAVACYLERFISDNSPDNTRIRQTAITAFLNKGWHLKDVEKFGPDGQVDGALFVTKDGRLELRR